MRYMRKLHPYLDILVSNIGEVFIPQSGKNPAHWTFGSKHSDGYRQVMIDGKRYRVHRLVAQTFLGEIPEGYQVDHLNRVRDDNRVENIRTCTPSQNQRNTKANDRVTERGGTHYYEDAQKARHEQKVRYRQSKRKTHRRIQFADGSHHWVSLPEAEAYLIIPLKQRTFTH